MKVNDIGSQHTDYMACMWQNFAVNKQKIAHSGRILWQINCETDQLPTNKYYI
jgi:hypothetical protein